MSDFITRMRDEKSELDEKIDKLTAFINEPFGTFVNLEAADQTLLTVQRSVMLAYTVVLDQRIKRALFRE